MTNITSDLSELQGLAKSLSDPKEKALLNNKLIPAYKAFKKNLGTLKTQCNKCTPTQCATKVNAVARKFNSQVSPMLTQLDAMIKKDG